MPHTLTAMSWARYPSSKGFQMSAFIVSESTIDAIVTAAIWGVQECSLGGGNFNRPYFQGRPLTESKAHALGECLWYENHLSVWHRYPSGERFHTFYLFPCKDGHFEVPALRPIIEVLKLIECLEYQSSEHEGWETSVAHKFCSDLRNRLINYLPGYDAAPWGLD